MNIYDAEMLEDPDGEKLGRTNALFNTDHTDRFLAACRGEDSAGRKVSYSKGVSL